MNLEELRSVLVDYYHRDRLYVGFVKDIKGKRLHLLTPSGKEELVSHAAVVFAGRERFASSDMSDLLMLLQKKQESREKLKETFDLKELWEVVVEEIEEVPSWELVSLYLGRDPTEDEVAAFSRKVSEERIYFYCSGINLIRVRKREEVKQILQQRAKEQERLKFLQEAEEFLKGLLANRELPFPEEVKNFWLHIFRNYIIHEETTEEGKLLKEVLQRHHLAEPLRVFEILSKRGLLPEDWFFELEKWQFPKDFKERELEESNQILKGHSILENRSDLTHYEVFTIDAADTEDFDDALSVEFQEEKTILWVHIAEVSAFIPPYSALWEGALQRACTLYLPEGVIPMFPFSLSHGKLSLRKGETKAALTFRFTLSKAGEVLSFSIIPSLIRVSRRYTYEEVDLLLEKKEPFWWRLYDLLMAMKKRRCAQGAFAVILPEINVRVKQDGSIEVERLEMTPARDLIAEAMILTNHYSAKFLTENQIPALYRAQREPYQVIEERETSLYHQILQLKFMARSEITLEPAYHSGLGLSCYTTLTSPIRRFLDLLIQHQIEAYLGGKAILTKEELLKLLPEIQSNSQRAQYLQNRRKRYFLLKYLSKQSSDFILRGIVMEIQGNKAKIYLPEYNLTGELLGFKRDCYPGQEIEVGLEKVNPLQEILRLRLI